ncbi:DALR anticodon-binding domain-containing protein [Streptomyces sp. CA-278952]|uniref:ArgS-related anticodon-binding protein NrtL n=1 Tax=unclassified Streptomyces TaxID=2593676 RepID=UPI002367B038|nr:DALR anticodon-binding domain-containing protein [Streptomyces sp. CA-278952]WDG28663.1 DALR anticodon-binding domain-containing protein [Streptomyces sp. CA-278952]
MTPADLSRTVLHAVRRAVDEDALRAPVPARVRVERTRPGGSGDYACAVALQLAGPAALPPLEVARILRERVVGEPGVGRVEITGPGFLSFTLDAPAAGDRAVLDAVREQGLAYGHGDALRDEILQFHHAREVRAAVTAHAVRRLVISQGARVRVSCEEASDPDWARLGVTVDAHGTPPVPLTGIRPVPAGATAGELLERLGPDAARWGLLRPAGHDRAALGPGLLVQGEANPLFRVRYAHARARALTRGAALLGFTAEPAEPALYAAYAAYAGPAAPGGSHPAHAPYSGPAAPGGSHPAPTPHAPYTGHGGSHPEPAPYGRRAEPAPGAEGPVPHDRAARPLLDLIADHPGVLLAAARHRAPDRVARQLEAVAQAFFDFHDSCPSLPSGDEKPSAAHRARLALAEAAGTVLAGGLSLLGIRAPEHL